MKWSWLVCLPWTDGSVFFLVLHHWFCGRVLYNSQNIVCVFAVPCLVQSERPSDFAVHLIWPAYCGSHPCFSGNRFPDEFAGDCCPTLWEAELDNLATFRPVCHDSWRHIAAWLLGLAKIQFRKWWFLHFLGTIRAFYRQPSLYMENGFVNPPWNSDGYIYIDICIYIYRYIYIYISI
jgi:hypothetical protein